MKNLPKTQAPSGVLPAITADELNARPAPLKRRSRTHPPVYIAPGSFLAWLQDAAPGGHMEGDEYVTRNPLRDDKHAGSFKINVHTGMWADFAETRPGSGGSDLDSLLRYLRPFDDAAAVRAEITAMPPAAGHMPARSTLYRALPVAPGTAWPLPELYEHPNLGKPVAIWRYYNVEGRLLGFAARFAPQSDDPKPMRTIRWCDDGRWHPAGFDEPRPLYGLDRLAARPDAPVIVCEGEKATDAATQLYPGAVAVTSPGGAKSARRADWAPLRGRKVYVSPDNDEPGARYARDVETAALAAGAMGVIVMDPCGGEAGSGYDLADLPPGAAPPPLVPCEASPPLVPIMNRSGTSLKWCMENALIWIRTNPTWDGVLAYNELEQQTMLLKRIPGTPGRFATRELRDEDVGHALAWFNRNQFPDATDGTIRAAMEMIARESIISPVRDYLEGLQWDGLPRISTWLEHHFGASPTDYVREVGKRWLISAVARALKPGCKADHMLVLEGRQGVGKSSALRALCGDDWFDDALRDMHSKDASQGLRGKWIIEVGELTAMRRSDVETVKAFITRQTERYIPRYGRSEVVEPRRCVFAGTTNGEGYLRDDTGNRRFWPVTISRADVTAVARERDQLWAEAVAAYKAGERWWLDRTMESVAAIEQAQRGEDDPWTGSVLDHGEALAATGAHVTARAIMVRMVLPPEKMGKTEAMRVTGVLKRSGWKPDGKVWERGPDRGQTRFVK